MSKYDYDLFVIGAGSGGTRAARISGGYGARVAIAEEYRFGGTCVIRGCVPKKLFVYASRFSEEFEDASGFGWTVGPRSFNWSTLVANKDAEIARLEGLYLKGLEGAGVEIFKSRAVLEDAHTIRIETENRTVTAEKILIATGGSVNYDTALPGIEHVITSNEAFHLENFPRRVVVAGGGYISVEFAGIFAGLGAETTIIYRGEEILRGFDDDLRRNLHEEYEKKGIKVICGQVFTRIEKTDSGLVGHISDGSTIEADEIMFAIGRKPNTDGLGLDTAGVALNDKGAVIVDDYSKTSIDHIFAVGDVTDRVNLTPVAIDEGHKLADRLFGDGNRPVDHETIATAVFSQPEIGTVGLTETEAREKYGQVDIYKSHFRPMKHTLSGRDEKMLMKLIVDAASDRVIGCHILGPDAAEIVQIAAISMRLGARKADFDDTMALHPSAAEELVTMRQKWQPAEAAE